MNQVTTNIEPKAEQLELQQNFLTEIDYNYYHYRNMKQQLTPCQMMLGTDLYDFSGIAKLTGGSDQEIHQEIFYYAGDQFYTDVSPE